MENQGTMAIHLIENLCLFKALDLSADEYESGYWALSPETADRLHGAHIYFHPTRAKPSYFGGQIIDHRVEEAGEYEGRIVFRLRAAMDHKGVTTDRRGWSMEKKIVW
jgi:hypothetical protein